MSATTQNTSIYALSYTLFLTSFSQSVMFVVPTSFSKRLLINRPVSAVFPCLNLSYALRSDSLFSSQLRNASIAYCRFSYVALREYASHFLENGGRTEAAFILPIPKSLKLCKPSTYLRSPQNQSRFLTAHRANSRLLLLSRYILNFFAISVLKTLSIASLTCWTRTGFPLLPTNSVRLSTTYPNATKRGEP